MEINRDTKQTLEDILRRRASIKEDTQQIREDIKALAKRLDAKPAVINKIITLVEKDREKGDVIDTERDIVDAASLVK